MSLGWQTESALLPKSSKKIKVDDGSVSMLALKAIVYKKEKEQKATVEKQNYYRKVKSNANSTSSSNNNNNNSSSNSKNNENGSSSDNVTMATLNAKAHLYDQLSRGNISHPIGDNFLVNFDDKKLIPYNSNDSSNVNTSNNNNNIVNDDYIEIIDSFGRNRRINKNSNEYEDFKLQEELKQKQHNLQQKRKRFHGDEGSDIPSSSSSGTSKWQWSRGENHNIDHVNDYVNNEYIKRTYQEVLDDRIDQEISKGARVKTKWEETLDSSAKQFIHEIHKEESTISSDNIKSNSKDDRRQLLLMKQQQKKLEIDSMK